VSCALFVHGMLISGLVEHAHVCADLRLTVMENVSHVGVKALAEAGCGGGLRTLILGGFWLCFLSFFSGL